MARSPPRRDHGHSRDYRDDRDRSRRDRSRSRERRGHHGRSRREYDREDERYGRLGGYDRYGEDRHRDGRPERYGGEPRREDRESDRRSNNTYRRRSSSRDSRDPRRSDRERSPLRGSRPFRRPREGDDSYINGREKRLRRGSRELSETPSRPGTSNGDSSRPAPASTPAEDATRQAEQRAKEERQKKVAAWKAQQVQKPAADSLASSGAGTAVGSPAPVTDEDSSTETTRPKFDPKAIKKQIQGKSKSDQATLGSDATVPALAANGTARAGNGAPRLNPAQGGQSVDRSDAKITGFGLNKAGGEKASDKSANPKASTTFDEDENVQRKFRKLPDLTLESTTSDAALADNQEDQDEGGDALRSDEEEAEVVRQAAIKRAEDAQAEQQARAMTDVAEASATDGGPMELDEEVDPLDAFMNDLDDAQPPPSRAKTALDAPKTRLFDDDDGPDLDAVGDNPEDLLNSARRKKKEMPAVDHSKIEYEPFRKNFYTESIEVREMSDDDVATLRAELDNITVRGLEPPKPITKWSQAGFGAHILDIIRENKFETPTSIQCQALPAIMSGRDTIGIAKTGSGKTLAFILPMFRHIKDQRPVANLEGPIGLIMAPTRELAVQIHRECKPYLKALNLRGVCAYGGAPIKDQIAELKRGAEVVVCTPGRLIDLLAANQGRVTNLRRVTYVVMDEADRMFDMGFEPQINKLLSNVRQDRQTVLFSATFPKKMETLARKALSRPVEIVVGGRSVVAAEITQMVEVRPETTKFRRVLELLGDLHESDEDARSLIFVERQETADSIFKELTKKGYPSLSVHGGREQIDRDQAILDFKSGAIPIMVATSVAARGLDVKQLKLVINFDSPNHGEDYVHRAGRTGRAGNTGTAVTFVTPEQERYAGFLVRCLEDSNTEVPEELKQMAESHKQKVEAGEANRIGSGFGGHGIERLDAARAAERAREKNMFKTGDEVEEENENAKKEKSKKESEVEKMVSKAASKVTERDAVKEKEAEESSEQGIRKDLLEHLNNALKVQKAEKSAAAPLPMDPVARAAAAAAAINTRLGTKGASRPGAPTDNRGPDAGAFHSHLEINDFPQKARWAVTNRTNVAKVLEATGTSITSKGEYYPAGKDPGPGDPPKLYILVEGDTDVAVQAAMRELSRHLTEGTLQAQEAESRGGTSGRYRVI